MPRIGSNPTKAHRYKLDHPADTTVALITYIPVLGGYWTHGLDVLKVCLQSIWKNTPEPFNVLIFDNASCQPVQDYLLAMHRQGAIHYLILSDANVGKVSAWNTIFAAAPGDIIAYADSDILFLPGWLNAARDILTTFPKTAIVTTLPTRLPAKYDPFNLPTITDADGDHTITVERGDFIPPHYRRAFSHSLGESEAAFRERDQKDDIRLTKQLVSAYVGASHFQFVTTKRVLNQIMPLPVQHIRGDDPLLDTRIAELGLWRLSTTDYLVHHMGNTLPPAKNNEIDWIDGIDAHFKTAAIPVHRTSRNIAHRALKALLRRKVVKRVLRRVNLFFHELLIYAETS